MDKEYGNSKHYALTLQGKSKRSKKTWNGTPRSIDCRESVGSCIKLAAIYNIKVGIVEAATYSQSNDSTTEIDNYADITVLGSNCLRIHDFEILVDVSGWDASAVIVE